VTLARVSMMGHKPMTTERLELIIAIVLVVAIVVVACQVPLR
jgi:hypothetical protein